MEEDIETEKQQVENSTTPPIQQAQGKQTLPVSDVPKAKPKLKLPILIGGIVACLIVAGATSAYFLNNNQKTKQESQAVASVSPTPNPIQNGIYSNSQYGFSFELPDNWIAKHYTVDDKDVATIGVDSIVDIAPQGYSGTAISIWSFNNPENLSLKEWDEQRNLKPGVDFFLYNASDKQIKTSVGIDMYQRIKGMCEPVYCDLYTFSHGDKIYRISSYKSPAEEGEKVIGQQQALDQILSTFKFTN